MPKFRCDKCSKRYIGNYCPVCGDKRTKKDEEEMTDTEIIVDMIEDTKESVSKKVKTINKKTAIGILLMIIAVILFFLGMYYKNAYYNDKDGKKSINAYVDADAYNYVINSNYFNGYMSLSGSFVISSVIVFMTDKKKRN